LALSRERRVSQSSATVTGARLAPFASRSDGFIAELAGLVFELAFC
jgi:hypothetical protein